MMSKASDTFSGGIEGALLTDEYSVFIVKPIGLHVGDVPQRKELYLETIVKIDKQRGGIDGLF